jgi:hypothetical protein
MGHLLLGGFIVQIRGAACYDARHTQYFLKIADSYCKTIMRAVDHGLRKQQDGKHE